MHKCVFTLGLILTSIYTVPAVAWPTKPATNIWTNSGHTTLANMRCDTCCKTNCWLPSGTYYDNVGTFSRSCSGEPSEPSCTPGATYSVVNGVCQGTTVCPVGYCDIGVNDCIYPSTIDHNYCELDGSCTSPNSGSHFEATEPGIWGVALSSVGITEIEGIVTCNNTPGDYGETTTANFTPQTVTGKYCWCKTTYPSDSPWIAFGDEGDAEYCGMDCAYQCAYEMSYNSSDLLIALNNKCFTCMNNKGKYNIGFSSCVDANTNSLDYGYGYIEFNGDEDGSSEFGLTIPGTWGTEFSYGKITGIASCNSTSGTHGVATNTNFNNTVTGRYCWCKMTSPGVSRWVFAQDKGSTTNCEVNCAAACSNYPETDSAFRKGLYTPVH